MNCSLRSRLPMMICFILLCCGLSSCMLTHQRCYEHAFATDGVYCADDAVYRSGGKEYAKGNRVQLRNVRYRSWESFAEAYYQAGWKMEPISGTEGEVVYHEVVADANGAMRFKNDAKWISLSDKDVKRCPEKKIARNVELSDAEDARRLTWRGIYAMPLAAACFAVEVPFNVVSVTLYLLTDFIGGSF